MKTTSRRAQKIWKRLGTWYGARMADQYGTEPPSDWAELIDRTDDERLEIALFAVRREHVNHPPTLGQFEAAIPQKRNLGGPSVAMQLAQHVVRHLSLCQHQLMRPWSYYGPAHEFTSKARGGEVVKHPDVAGVVIAECKDCGRPSHRVKVEDLAGSAAA